jgi:hypothetical protein
MAVFEDGPIAESSVAKDSAFDNMGPASADDGKST